MKINRQAPKGSTILNLVEPGQVFSNKAGELFLKLHYAASNNAFHFRTRSVLTLSIVDPVIQHESILTVK